MILIGLKNWEMVYMSAGLVGQLDILYVSWTVYALITIQTTIKIPLRDIFRLIDLHLKISFKGMFIVVCIVVKAFKV